ncbi:MAG: methyltransferase domain-containing protein [Magnetococcales bacterium]|nr:methyltransferase domain-containing protein [Magnetococcales bacterium]
MTARHAPPVRTYSKSSGFYQEVKKDFFTNNANLLQTARRQNALYAAQPRRTRCKLCEAELPGVVDFTSHGVDYLFCSACGHLNGGHEETATFIDALYIAEEGEAYATHYIDAQYERRIRDIYLPKVDYLRASLPEPATRLLDIGCGSGHFVCAARMRGLEAQGIDVNKRMIDFGNHQIANLLGTTPLAHTREEEFFELVAQSDAQILSAIGVIEHLREPQRFFAAFRASRIEYLFYSIPMFSFSVMLEHLFQNVFPRQLSGGHTHMFTETSFQTLNERLAVHSLAEWRFGVDIMDLYRSCMTTLGENGTSEQMTTRLREGLAPCIDALQAQLDQHHFCSILHCLTRRDNHGP